jgi:hypothetical protein
MTLKLSRIQYEKLNSRQQENYNFQKVAGFLADYGFNCLNLSDDWQGADFLACHINGCDFLKVQLKGRMVIDQKYAGKNIYIAFLHGSLCYLYPHDEMRDKIYLLGYQFESRSWPKLPKWALELLENYRL